MSQHGRISTWMAFSLGLTTLAWLVFSLHTSPRMSTGTRPTAEARLQLASAHFSAADRQRILAASEEMPLHFVPNGGQMDRRVRYSARGEGYAVHFTATE